MNDISNPGEKGPQAFETVIYAAPGLDYSLETTLEQYRIYENPTLGFSTRLLDISDIADVGFGADWPFDSSNIPLNGHICIPQGTGPFPLVLFAHGNHNPIENSTPGYLYLCELLASYGILGATIDVNFLNGFNQGENDGRAIVHLEHVKQFQLWNDQLSHPLAGKVDLSKTLLVGHSRGGEAVGHASFLNPLSVFQFEPSSPPIPLDGSQGLGPYQFDLQGVVAIAPTDRQYEPPAGPTAVQDNYLLLHGSRDNDVFDFPGQNTYERSHRVDLSNPTQTAAGFKSLVWIYGANHNFFNSVWDQESSNTITRDQQEQIASVYISAFAQAVLQDQETYRELLTNHTKGVTTGWLSNAVNIGYCPGLNHCVENQGISPWRAIFSE